MCIRDSVYTNLNPDIQKYIWNVYNTDDYIYYPNDSFQVASTIIDVTNGRVVAQLGSRHQDENIALATNQAVQTAVSYTHLHVHLPHQS